GIFQYERRQDDCPLDRRAAEPCEAAPTPNMITIGAAQLGPIQRADGRADVVKRLLALLHEAKARGCELVVFPELALTTFFPRWYISDWAEVDRFFEPSMPSTETQPLFDAAAKLGVGFYLGYCELAEEGGKR